MSSSDANSGANSSGIPDFIEEFVGWRSWRINQNGQLTAIGSSDAIWTPGEALSAVCMHGKRHPVPFMNCTCGFYATKTYDQLVDNGYAISGDVWGTVSFWGRVIDATMGYRAQFAYPREIWTSYTLLRAIPDLAVYGVPVRLANPYTFNEKEH